MQNKSCKKHMLVWMLAAEACECYPALLPQWVTDTTNRDCRVPILVEGTRHGMNFTKKL